MSYKTFTKMGICFASVLLVNSAFSEEPVPTLSSAFADQEPTLNSALTDKQVPGANSAVADQAPASTPAPEMKSADKMTVAIIVQSPSEKSDAKSKHPFSDTAITAKVKEKFIEEKLFGKEKVAVMTVHVKTINSVVFLSGKVRSKDQAETAVSLAKSVKGVKAVRSQIKVKR